ncbi:MAG TPA: hypothetical protein VIZ17_01790 [Acetobacteraceae bacterium]
MQGIVTIVQEGRFQLTDGDGVSHSFVLSYRAPVEPEQLGPLQRRQALVRVEYRKAENVIGLLATGITGLDG